MARGGCGIRFKSLDKLFHLRQNKRDAPVNWTWLDWAPGVQPLDSLWLFWPDALQVYLYPTGFPVDYQVLVLLSAGEAL